MMTSGVGVRWGAILRRWVRVGLDVVFGPSCVVCGRPVEPGEGALRLVCAACSARLVRVGPPSCRWCGHPLAAGAVPGVGGGCRKCHGLEPVYGEGRTAILLSGPGRRLVHLLKYHGGLYLRDDLTRLFGEAPGLVPWVAGAVLVPVPLHRRKERERGYNQAEELAKAVVRAVREAGGVEPEVRRLLVRVRDTPTQTRLDRRARRTNLKNAFALAPRAVVQSSFRHILVDDVFTTGSTLNACARALRAASVRRVDVLTLGHG